MHQPSIDEAQDAVNRSILVTGIARSGTSLMGQLIHSLEGVQYLFEPPVLYRLLELHAAWNRAQHLSESGPRTGFFYPFSGVLETHLYSELLDLVLGRRNNTRLQDSSNVIEAKGPQFVGLQHLIPETSTDQTIMARGQRLCWKMPDIGTYLPGLMDRYPGLRVVIMVRNQADVVASLIAKGWYRDGCPWVYDTGGGVPFWFEGQLNEWQSLTEEERCTEHYLRNLNSLTTSAILDSAQTTLIPYERFVSKPDTIFTEVASWLGLKPTEYTEALLARVHS